MQLQQIQDDEQREVERLAALESGKLLKHCYSNGPLLIYVLFCFKAEKAEKAEKDKKEEAAKSSRPSGTGDTFSPGEWNPTSSRRR